MNQKGFTFIETLVAITILIFAVTGTFAASRSGILTSTFSKDELVAIYLAQEGVEQIRNLRDQNIIQGRNWLTGIAANPSDACYFGHSCTVDAPNDTISACSGGDSTCPPLRQDLNNGFYGHRNNWTVTPFTRSVSLTSINANEVRITSTITWSKSFIPRTFVIREIITNWQ